MHFTTLNLKIADEFSQNLCMIELVVVKHRRITNQKSWLIRPNPFYISPLYHKREQLKLADFIDAPTLLEIWPEILPYLQGQFLFCHKALWMMSILSKALDNYKLPYPDCEIGCSLMMSKRVYPHLIGHQLDQLESALNFTPSTHINSAQALQTAFLILHLAQVLHCPTIRSLLETLEIQLGNFDSTQISKLSLPSFNGSLKMNLLEPLPNKDLSPTSPYNFIHKVVCLTGPLESMARVDAVKKIHALGATYSSSVTNKTNVVITNVKNPELLPLDTLTSKLRRAIILKAQGQSIDILSEEVFLQALKNVD